MTREERQPRDTALVIGLGQIGTFAARALELDGFEVSGADASASPGYFARFGPRAAPRVSELDVRDRSGLAGLLERCRCSVIILCTGMAARDVESEPERAHATFVDGTRNVLEAAANDARIHRIVLTSSFAVYGGNGGLPIAEDGPREPVSNYGAVLAAAEDVLREASRLERVILRPAGVYGPIAIGRGSHSARLIERLLVRASMGLETEIEAGPDDYDEYVYVKDVATAIAAAARVPLRTGLTVLNVGSGRVSGAQDLVDAIRAVFPSSIVRIRAPEASGRPRTGALDMRRARSVLGFEARYDLTSGIRDYASVDLGQGAASA